MMWILLAFILGGVCMFLALTVRSITTLREHHVREQAGMRAAFRAEPQRDTWDVQ